MRPRDLWTRRARWAPQLGRLSELCEEQQEALAVVRSAEPHLKPGLYIASGPAAWRHWSSPLPGHVHRTKGHAFRAAQLTDPFVRRVVRRLPALRRPAVVARRLVLPLVPPYAYWSRGSGHVTAAVGTHDGAAVLMAPARGQVIRAHRAEEFDAGYEQRRQVFEKHLSSPPFEVLQGGSAIREEFVAGRYFFDLTLGERLQVTRSMIAGYESLTRAEGAGGSQAMVRPVRKALARATPPEDVADLLRGALAPGAVRHWARVPSATDPRPKNTVITEDLVPVFIDLGSLRLDPFFYYPLGFITHAGRGVREAFLRGELDGDLGSLFSAAGAEYRADEQGRLRLIALRVLIASYKECSPGGVFDVPRFNWVIRRRWRSTFAD